MCFHFKVLQKQLKDSLDLTMELGSRYPKEAKLEDLYYLLKAMEKVSGERAKKQN